jgi:hypothetical protein
MRATPVFTAPLDVQGATTLVGACSDMGYRGIVYGRRLSDVADAVTLIVV